MGEEPKPLYEIAVATVFSNEAPYLKEWIDYHLHIGVEHFWLYDDCSTDAWQEGLKPYIEQGCVEVLDWSDARAKIQIWPAIQIEAYKHAIGEAQGKAKWLALIDTDEFILVKKEKTLAACLQKHYDKAAAVYVQWLVFGTNGVTLEPGQSLLQSLTACSRRKHPWNNVGKTIVRPDQVAIERVWTVHHVPLLPSSRWFNGSGEELFMIADDLSFQSHDENFLRINHYFFRDEHFFRNVKIPRKLKRDMKLQELFDLYEECGKSQNREIKSID